VPRTHACEDLGNKNDLKQQRTTNKLSKLLLQFVQSIISELVAATVNNTNIIEFIFCNIRQTVFKI